MVLMIMLFSFFFILFFFSFLFTFWHSDLFLRDGSGKSGSSEAFGLILSLSPRGKSESAKSESSGLADLSDRTGRILWFYFVCDCNCYLLLGGGSVGCAMGEEMFVDCVWSGLDWNELERTRPDCIRYLGCPVPCLSLDQILIWIWMDMELDG
jgi:hypothetical protein